MFSSKSFIVFGLRFRPLIHFEFIFVYGVRLEVFLSHSFTCSYPVFLARLTEDAVFSPLYILACFVKDRVPIGRFISRIFILFHWSMFLFLFQYHTVLMTVILQYSLKSGRLILPAPFFFLKIALSIQGLLCFHQNFEIVCSSSVKNADNLMVKLACKRI